VGVEKREKSNGVREKGSYIRVTGGFSIVNKIRDEKSEGCNDRLLGVNERHWSKARAMSPLISLFYNFPNFQTLVNSFETNLGHSFPLTTIHRANRIASTTCISQQRIFQEVPLGRNPLTTTSLQQHTYDNVFATIS
jgi:hypothetical protein